MRITSKKSTCFGVFLDPDPRASNRPLEKSPKKPYNACIGAVLDRDHTAKIAKALGVPMEDLVK